MKTNFSLTILIVFLICQNANSQDNRLADITSKWTSFSNRFPSEHLYVHTDKNVYTAGEIIWFKIYHLDTALKAYGVSSKVAYIELIDHQRSAVIQTKIEMDEKSGAGALDLPLTLHSGYYTLRAYTNWMKNFGASQFFEKKITIINTLRSLDVPDSLPEHGSIQLFPEGGNLVSGIPSQVGFRVVNKLGQPAFGTGYLLTERNDTVRIFSPYKFGIGSFDFTPDPGHSYKAIFVLDDNTIVAKALPQIYSDGYVMHVEEDEQRVQVQVRSNQSTTDVFLVVQNRGLMKAAKKNTLQNGTVSFVLDKSELGMGVSQLTVFNSAKQAVCERLFFISPSSSESLRTSITKESYSNRERVSLSISGLSSTSSLSISVYQYDSLQTDNASNIQTYFWLESELNGQVVNPGYYLSGNSAEIKKAADQLMLTQGWRRFNWNSILNSTSDIVYAPEILGQTITCKVTDVNGTPANDVQVFLSIPETTYKLYSASTNNSGVAKINVWDFYGKGEMILQTKRPEERFRINVIHPFFDQYVHEDYPPFTISSANKSLLENYSIAMQAQHIYTADSIQRFLAPQTTDTFPFFGRALTTYKLDDYTRFTTMEEVLREYVREVNVGTRPGGNLEFKLLNDDFKIYNSDNILVLVDGVPFFQPNKVFSLDPLKIQKIGIIPKNFFVGSSFFLGVANFSSYKGNLEGVDIDPNAIRIDYEGLQIKREFYSPDYSIEERRNSRIPDLRSTLFWSPDVRSGKMEFYTGDNKGKYLVVVEGMTNSGQPLSSTATFEVK
jgi:hypothetical protein